MVQESVTTVLGDVSPSDLGITLMHEHVFCSLLSEYRGDGWLNDGAVAVTELNRFREAGGQTVVDLTLRGMGRRPEALRKVSEETGLHIIAGTGLYRHQYYDADWVDCHSADDISAWMVQELEEGIEGTGIRAGIIGEIGCDEYITAQEERVFRAAGRAHLRTGITVSTHAARWPVGHMQLDVLEEEGVEPRRVVLGHCDTVTAPGWNSTKNAEEYYESLIRRGAFVSFDHFGAWASEYDDTRAIEHVVKIVDKGFAEHVILSQDVCFRSTLHAHGGNGYDYLLTDVVPRLREAGMSENTIRTILVDNPRRALTGENPSIPRESPPSAAQGTTGVVTN